jgi:soluble cytochrome b562
MRAGRIAAAVLLLSACAASQEQADVALKAAEDAITAQHADAMRFAPEAFDAVMASYDSARAAHAAGDWAAAVAAAERTAARARQLAPAIADGRERVAAHWPLVRDSVAAMLAAVRERLGEVARTRRYPAGMTAADVRGAQARADSLAVGLDRARGAFEQGDLAAALHAVERVRAQAVTLMGAVGLPPSPPGR